MRTAPHNGAGWSSIYRDADFWVVCKMPGLATTAPKGGDCLVARLQATLRRGAFFHATSRLDREVSGLVTFALSPAANQCLLAARREGQYLRRYRAFLSAPLEPRSGSWQGAIAIDPADKSKRRVSASAQAKPATTRYRCTEVLSSGVSQVELFPETGRTHQLRVQASHAGAPMLGDAAYGGPRRTTLEDGRVVAHSRVLLHCEHVSFPSPGKERLQLDAPLPDDMRTQWEALASS